MGSRDEVDSTADLFADQLMAMLGKRLHIQVEVERTDSGLNVGVKLIDRKTKQVLTQNNGHASFVGGHNG